MKKALNENILGYFSDRSRIQPCVARLRNLDFSAKNISVEQAHPDKVDPDVTLFGLEKKTKGPESALTTSLIAAGLGATLGALLYSQLALEAWAAILLGIFLGAVFGAIVGLLVGHLVQDHDESDAAREMRPYEVLLTVHVEDEEHERIAKEILTAAGARIQVVPKEKDHEIVIPSHL